VTTKAGTGSRLARFARDGSRRAASPPQERCDLCAQPVGTGHRHLLDLAARQIRCACGPCSILFDQRAAEGNHYRLLPDRVMRIPGDVIDDATWSGLGIPVGIAFFFHSSSAGRPVGFYPGPLGATESALDLKTWSDVQSRHESLRDMEPDVEALLVNRTKGSHECWLVPVDECYRLVAVIRTHWSGFAGGEKVWDAIRSFFDSLRHRDLGRA
jgi:hypothetical protein